MIPPSSAHDDTLDLESVRCFVAAADSLNFRVAAGRVHLSPAAFGERIRRLEERLGARLFDRTTRRVDLTPAGARLRPAAEAVLAAARECAVVVGEDRRAPFELTVGTRHELGMSWLVPSLDVLSRAEPARKIHLEFGAGPDLVARVRAGEIDAAVASLRLPSARLTYVNLHEERYCFVGSPALLERSPLDEPGDAEAHTLVDIRPGFPLFSYFMDAAPAEIEWRFGGHEFMGTIAAIRARALAGRGVAVLPRYFVARDLDRGRLVSVMTDVEPRADHFRLIWRAGHPRDRDLRVLAEALRGRPLR